MPPMPTEATTIPTWLKTGAAIPRTSMASSAVDTDFTAKLIDVWPNGFAQNLTEGISLARYRNSEEGEEFLNPGENLQVHRRPLGHQHVFRSGHRLRVEISSSNFPRFDRNLNSGEQLEEGIHMVKATNTIYHDAEHPSALVLPAVHP